MKAKPIPKNLEKVFYLYPIVHLLLLGIAIIWFIKSLSILSFACLAFISYLMSPLIWRLIQRRYPLTYGFEKIGKKSQSGSLWMVSYQLQHLYNSYAVFEKVLKTFPEAYSAWLRLWGAKVGEKNNWTSGCEVVDRPYLSIGDRCLVGNKAYLSAHVIKKSNGNYILYTKPLELGSDIVLSFFVTIGPGIKIEDECFVEAGGTLYPNYHLKKGETYARYQELSQ